MLPMLISKLTNVMHELQDIRNKKAHLRRMITPSLGTRHVCRQNEIALPLRMAHTASVLRSVSLPALLIMIIITVIITIIRNSIITTIIIINRSIIIIPF